jgi:hypothetical protein
MWVVLVGLLLLSWRCIVLVTLVAVNHGSGKSTRKFLWTYKRTCIKLHVLLGENELECDKWLKEDLGTHASSYETVHWCVSAIKNGWEETENILLSGAPTSVMDECHRRQVKFALEHMRGISCMGGNFYRSQNLSSNCLPFSYQQLGKKKSLCRVDFTHAPQ